MADNTKISWTDATWNVLTGCTKVNGQCVNCSAARDAYRLQRNPNPKIAQKYESVTDENGEWTGKVNIYEPELLKPLEWTKSRMVFPNYMSDWAHGKVKDEWRDRIFGVMALATWHKYQLLTKRPPKAFTYLSNPDTKERIYQAYLHTPLVGTRLSKKPPQEFRFPLPHVWIGFSIGDQQTADNWSEVIKDIAALGWLTWVSYEPAIAPVDWSGYEFIKWMVMGGESARPRNKARPSHPCWFRSTRDWASANNIALHFKQWGEWFPVTRDTRFRAAHQSDPEWHIWEDEGFESTVSKLIGKKAAGRILDGKEWNEFPEMNHA